VRAWWIRPRDLKAAYEQAIGHQTSDSTIYNVRPTKPGAGAKMTAWSGAD
jgi:hypothetical protein